MIVKVDKTELKNVSNDLMKSSDDIKNEINLWKKKIEELKTIWKGKDADIFYSRIDAYLIKLDMLTESSSAISKFINAADEQYIAKDEEFATAIRRERERYEPITERDIS